MNYYRALFERAEEGGFVVTFPGFSFGVTQGDTEEEAQKMASDALALIIESYIERNQPLPAPPARRRPTWRGQGRRGNLGRGRRYRPVHLPAMQMAKIELYRKFTASGISKAELARRMGISKPNVD